MYDTKSLSCNGHNDMNISESGKRPCMELLVMLYKSLMRLQSSKAARNHEK